MGRRGKRNEQRNNESDVSGDESGEYESEFINSSKPLWTIYVQDADEDLIDTKFEYEQRDIRFKWIHVSDIQKFVHEALYNKNRYRSFKKAPKGGIEYIIQRFIWDIVSIMNLDNIPIVGQPNDNIMVDPETGVVNPIYNKYKFMLYMNHRIIDHFDKYCVN